MKASMKAGKMKMQVMNSLKYQMQEALKKCMVIWPQKDSSQCLMIMYMFKERGF